MPVDGGKIADRQGSGSRCHGAKPVEMIWRATYPVVEPPHGLWLSRLRKRARLARRRTGSRRGFTS